MQTRVLTIETPETFERALSAAAELLKQGEVVAVPTETVYGLAANAFSAAAVRKIYQVKGRPAANPIIVHIASLDMALECVQGWPEPARILARLFWPGPLTMVLPKSAAIPSVVTAGGRTVGVRWPLHPFMQELIRRCGFPLAAPSANQATQLSPTTADHVQQSLGGKIPLIIDAGAANVGIESTVVDLSESSVRVLRPGMISAAQIETALGQRLRPAPDPTGALKSPGLLRKHYSPRARLHIIRWRDDQELSEAARATAAPFDRIAVLAHDKVPQLATFKRVAVIPFDPEAYARALYHELHQADAAGVELILVEMPPPGPAWDGIRDRLSRASADG